MKKYYKYKMKTLSLNIYSLILFFGLFFFVLIFKKNIFFDLDFYAFVIMILWMILHELLHYLGFMFNKGIKIKNLTLGMKLENGIFYCMCKQKISKKAIIQALIFPLFFIGIVTLIIGLIINNKLLMFLSILNIAGAIGDIFMTILMLKLPNDIEYMDLDDCTAFYIISKSDIIKIKVPCLEIVESGKYDEKAMKPTNKKIITISLVSRIVLLVLLVFFVLSLMLK